MHTRESLTSDLHAIGISPNDTLHVHSSMKAIGEVLGGAEAMLDALIEYMRPGMLTFPTHTWKTIGSNGSPVFDPLKEPSCVGLLTNLFMKRSGVVRSLHPTHSMAALGEDAAHFIRCDDQGDSPCPQGGCYWMLQKRKAKILFLGTTLKTNTFLHGVEEWNNIPERLAESPVQLFVRLPGGREIPRLMREHRSPAGDVSQNYDKMEEVFLNSGIARKGMIGDAGSILCEAFGMAEVTNQFLRKNPQLFADNLPFH